MGGNSADDHSVSERWDECLQLLSARPRRQIVRSLLRVPPGAPLPLPNAARASDEPVDGDRLSVALHHRHLPALADAGYVEWSTDPFLVSRGPRFAEPASVVRVLIEGEDEDELASALAGGFVEESV